ncbi:MAG: homocysteine S-methyltransferase family protein, partial [Mucinivorans sp.]
MIKILDGAFGTQIQLLGLGADDFAGQQYMGCNDYLCLTRPEVVERIHLSYLEAGADIISTNSFNANAISLREYGLQDSSFDICRAAAQIARRAVNHFGGKAQVAGSVGPTSVSLTLMASKVSFDELAAAYATQIDGLIQGG